MQNREEIETNFDNFSNFERYRSQTKALMKLEVNQSE